MGKKIFLDANILIELINDNNKLYKETAFLFNYLNISINFYFRKKMPYFIFKFFSALCEYWSLYLTTSAKE